MSESSPAVKVARGASFVLLQNMGSTLVQIIVFAIIARLITEVDLGILAALTFVVGFSQIAVNLGLPSAATKFISELLGKNSHQEAASVCYQTLKISLILSGVSGAFCFLFSDQISILLLKTAEYSALFKILSLDIVVTGLYGSFYGILGGMQKFREASIFNLTRLAIRHILIVSALILGFGLLGLVAAWFIGDLSNAILYSSIIFKSFGFPKFTFSLKRLLKYSYPLYFSGVISFIYGWFDQALLLAFLSLGELGIYSVALRAFGALTGIIAAVQAPLFPKYSEMYARGGPKSVEKAIYSASRYICYMALPLAFGLFALAAPALTALVGERYLLATQPLGILCLFFAATCIQVSLSGILLVLELTWITLGLTVLNIVFGTVLGVLLLPTFGIVGVSIARGITMVLTFLVFMWVLRGRINVTFDKEALWKSLVSSIAMTILLIFIQNLWNSASLLPLYLGLGAFAYLAMLRVLKATKQSDIELLRRYVGRRLEFAVKPLEMFLLS